MKEVKVIDIQIINDRTVRYNEQFYYKKNKDDKYFGIILLESSKYVNEVKD